jgi:hypothetical protein
MLQYQMQASVKTYLTKETLTVSKNLKEIIVQFNSIDTSNSAANKITTTRTSSAAAANETTTSFQLP